MSPVPKRPVAAETTPPPVTETTIKPRRGRPAKPAPATSTSVSGLSDGKVRATFIVYKHKVDALKERADSQKKYLQEVVDEAFTDYLAKPNKEGKNHA
jgi:hypothetical protein